MKNRHYVLGAAVVMAVLCSSASALVIDSPVTWSARTKILDQTDGYVEIVAGGSLTANARVDHNGGVYPAGRVILNGGNFTSTVDYKLPDNATGNDALIWIYDGTFTANTIEIHADRLGKVEIGADGTMIVETLYQADYSGQTASQMRDNPAVAIADGKIYASPGYDLVVTDLGGGAVQVTTVAAPRAYGPDPDGTVPAPLNTDLIWTAADCMTLQDVWFTHDPNLVTDPNFTIDNPGAKIASDITATTIDNATLVAEYGSTLQPETTYYWRVDSAGGGGAGCPDAYVRDANGIGDPWSFTTTQLAVQIITQPLSTVVDAGGTANFEIVGIQVQEFTWYKVGVPDVDVLTLGSDYAVVTVDQTSTLSVSNPETHYGEEYYCTVDNSVPSSLDSNHVFLYTKKLLAHWKFEENLDCEIDVANNGTASPFAASYDNAAPVSTEAGYAVNLAYENPNQVVAVSSTMENLPQVTISLWMKANTVEGGGAQTTLLKADGSDADGIKMWLDSGNINFGIEGNSGAANDIEPVPGQWYHFVGVFDSIGEGRLKIYVNGLREDRSGLDDDPFVLANVSPLTIGGWNDGTGTIDEVFDGLIDDVRIYNYKLTDEQIASLYVDWVDTYLCDGGGLDGLSTEAAPFDVNGDCTIDLADFAAAAAVWLECARVEEGGCIFDLPPLE
ncbi:MAG: hypothetical protein J7M40_14410 [Planctomycetes bacterium]|nr:hypothetical protein [Planctomycetota bacterium]